ncbi:MAG TPA: trypsin-like peptidase domain-containing protein [Xanthomonadales bacterium]|nr:trypsin-like peptidase domain-containing protein [Xanthomonadales bacterium]
MNKLTQMAGFLFRALVAGLAVAFVVLYFWPQFQQPENKPDAIPAVNPATEAGKQTGPFSYADAVDLAAPAVVSVYTTSLDPQAVDPETQELLGRRMLYRMRRDMGSGVLVSADGYILTNHHVISTAQNIRVGLWDQRIAQAQVVGSDPQTDLAVLKINLTGLPTIPIKEIDPVRVGDVVLAIGNALGLSHTVTMGIISATGRNTQDSFAFEGFLQTDAAINAGNSGGALINARGELIGINTRHLGGATGAQNIGFAIPMATAQEVMKQIIDYGSVRRGWLGAWVSNLASATALDGQPQPAGLVVQKVFRDSPAWDAGVRQGDVILKLNDELVSETLPFELKISSILPGTKVELEVNRNGQSFQTYATLIQQPPME